MMQISLLGGMATDSAKRSEWTIYLNMQLEHEGYSYNKYRMEVQGALSTVGVARI
jgi:hypothetical protein